MLEPFFVSRTCSIFPVFWIIISFYIYVTFAWGSGPFSEHNEFDNSLCQFFFVNQPTFLRSHLRMRVFKAVTCGPRWQKLSKFLDRASHHNTISSECHGQDCCMLHIRACRAATQPPLVPAMFYSWKLAKWTGRSATSTRAHGSGPSQPCDPEDGVGVGGWNRTRGGGFSRVTAGRGACFLSNEYYGSEDFEPYTADGELWHPTGVDLNELFDRWDTYDAIPIDPNACEFTIKAVPAPVAPRCRRMPSALRTRAQPHGGRTETSPRLCARVQCVTLVWVWVCAQAGFELPAKYDWNASTSDNYAGPGPRAAGCCPSRPFAPPPAPLSPVCLSVSLPPPPSGRGAPCRRSCQ